MAPLMKGATPWNMEYSIHHVPPTMKREILTVFPQVNLDKLLIVPTCQHAAVDLVKTGENVENEKDRLLEQFLAWAKTVCDQLTVDGHWSDYIDPCSGLPVCLRYGYFLKLTGPGGCHFLVKVVGFLTVPTGAQRNDFCIAHVPSCGISQMIHTELNTVYPEVPALSILMGYQTANAGCCKVLLHPVWGSAVYPASLFTEAPQDTLLAAITTANDLQVE
ncbi:hypothetical protein Vretimale_2326 [Volvox reticuliferus]|uniref:Uncharacterized protein n=1 Tax=Volvox reticuliferus TaxID=1737510 RepID=A0A8J4C5X7_9CHLO|nr:hypothetical protein Vretifemale_4614 [Volvox reticuliferus]GIL96535.1 hypothetical protein Vretimale_2326 [Volvox reticuliferus]